MSFRCFAAVACILSLASVAVAADTAETFSVRKRMLLMASPATADLVNASVEHLRARLDIAPPQIETVDVAAAFLHFCGGVGPEHADMVAAQRRISRGEFRRCEESGVGDIIEVAVGYAAATLVLRADAPPLLLTSEQIFRALARDLPRDDGFAANTARTWKDIDRTLPSLDIRVVTTARGTPARILLEDKVLQAGCVRLPEIRAIRSADTRVARCVDLRGDHRLVEVATPEEALAQVDAASPGAIAVVPLRPAETSGQRYQRVPIDGVLPNGESIRSREYRMTQRIYYYFKVRHMRDRKGYGVASYLRELMDDATGEGATGPNGYFVAAGLVPLDEDERLRQQRAVAALMPMER
jgi:phosphate transport system substrate-binding protein